MTRAHGHLLAAMGIALAACGGAVAQSPPGVSAWPSGSASPGASAAGSATSPEPRTDLPPAVSSASPSSSAAALPPAPPPAAVEMKGPAPTAMVADLQAIGLDAKSLPRLEKLEPKALRLVMKLFARSLGAKCGDCHLEGDFAAPTRRKKIAVKMWDEFAVKLATADGAPLFCDSCHQGRIVQLDRRDKKALGQWMDANFVDKLKRKDGKDHGCETCHVDMEMTFLTKWGG